MEKTKAILAKRSIVNRLLIKARKALKRTGQRPIKETIIKRKISKNPLEICNKSNRRTKKETKINPKSNQRYEEFFIKEKVEER
jgi:hypothetical protein